MGAVGIFRSFAYGAAVLALTACDAPAPEVTPSAGPTTTEAVAPPQPTLLRASSEAPTPPPRAASPHTPEVRAAASAIAATPDPEATSFARVAKAEAITTPAPPGGFMAAATTCLADPACPMERYAGLVFAAVDAHDPKVPCLDLVRGSGVPIDLTRARTCLAAEVARNGDCGGSSPSLERLQLALLVAIGRGGARSTEEAGKVLTNCYADGSVAALDEVFATLRRGENPSLKSVEFCEAELAMTTLHMSRCVSQDIFDQSVRARALEKALFTKSDRATVERFRAASGKFAGYTQALAENAGDLYRGGSLAVIEHPAAISFATRQRLSRWESYVRGAPRPARDAKTARREVVAQKEKTRTQGDAAWRSLFHAMDVAYSAYRAEEAPLMKSLPGMTKEAVESTLDDEWIQELQFVAGPD